MHDLATLRRVPGGGSGATTHHHELVVREDAPEETRERERIGALAHQPVRVEKLAKPGEVHELDVSGIRAETGLLRCHQRNLTSGTHEAYRRWPVDLIGNFAPMTTALLFGPSSMGRE